MASEASSFSISSPLSSAVAAALNSPGSAGRLVNLDPAVVPDFAREPESAVLALYRDHPDAASLVDSQGRLPLHHAVNVQRPSAEVVKLLLEKNRAAARTQDAHGNTPLHVLVQQRVAKVWRLAPRAFGFGKKGNGTPNIALAAKPLVPRTVIKKLLAVYPDAALVRNSQGLVPVRLALSRSAPSETIDELLSLQPLTASAPEADGSYLLHFAATCKPRVVTWHRVLSAYPQAASERDSNGMLPVHLALVHELPLTHVTPLLEQYPDGAVQPDRKGQTLLHFAADIGSPANVMSKIIEYNPTATSTMDHSGNTPLHYACSSSKATEEVVTLLMKHRPRAVAKKNFHGHTPLHMAYTPRIAYLLLHRLWCDANSAGKDMAAPLLAEDRQLIARASQYAGFACWHGVASAALVDAATPIRTDRTAMASALFAFAPTAPPAAAGIGGGDASSVANTDETKADQEIKGTPSTTPPNIPALPVLSFAELCRLAGAPPDVSHWSTFVVQHWMVARGWLQSEDDFAKGVAGAQICAWLDQDNADQMDVASAGSTLCKGLRLCGISAPDALHAVEEIKRVFEVRLEFEQQMHLEPMFNACARGHLAGVEFMIHTLQEKAMQKLVEGNPEGSMPSTPPPVYLDYVGLSGMTPLLTCLTQALERSTSVARAIDGVDDDDADRAESGHTQGPEVATLLLRAGASPTNDAGTDMPPVHVALLCALQSRDPEWLEVVDLMLSLGANINSPDAEGNTCLHHAVRLGSAEVCRVLLTRGALLESTNLAGQTASDLVQGADADAINAVLHDFVQVKVEARLLQRTVLPRAAVAEDKLSARFTDQFGLRTKPQLTVEGDGSAGEASVKLEVAYAEDLASLSWPSRPIVRRAPAGKPGVSDAAAEEALPDSDEGAGAGARAPPRAAAATTSGIRPGVVRAHEAILGVPQLPAPAPGSALRMRQLAARALLEEVNLPQLPVRMVLIYEGVDFRTNEEWVESTYRLMLLCDHEGCTACSDMHSGYTVEAPGELLRTALPAFQVAASLLQLQNLTGKYKHIPVPSDMPGMVDLAMAQYPALGLIVSATRPLLFPSLPRPEPLVPNKPSEVGTSFYSFTPGPKSYENNLSFLGPDFGVHVTQVDDVDLDDDDDAKGTPAPPAMFGPDDGSSDDEIRLATPGPSPRHDARAEVEGDVTTNPLLANSQSPAPPTPVPPTTVPGTPPPPPLPPGYGRGAGVGVGAGARPPPPSSPAPGSRPLSSASRPAPKRSALRSKSKKKKQRHLSQRWTHYFVESPDEAQRAMAMEYQAACLDALIFEVNDRKKAFKDAYVAVAKMLKRMHWETGDHGLKKVQRDDGFTMWVCAQHALDSCYTVNVENIGAKPSTDAPKPSALVNALTRVDQDADPAPLVVPGLVPVRVVSQAFRAPIRTAVNPLSPFMSVEPEAPLSQRTSAAWARQGVNRSGSVLPKQEEESKPWFYAVATEKPGPSQKGTDTLDHKVSEMHSALEEVRRQHRVTNAVIRDLSVSVAERAAQAEVEHQEAERLRELQAERIREEAERIAEEDRGSCTIM